MKTFKVLLSLFVLFQSYGVFSQDTISSYIKSPCLQFVMPLDKLPVYSLRIVGDKLFINGQIQANCAGTHLAIVNRTADTLFVTTKDTGLLANCFCVFEFELSLNITPATKILVFQDSVINLSTITDITHLTDTITGFFTSQCMPIDGVPYPTPTFERQGDSISMTGKIGANCAGTHLAIVHRSNDSIYITTKDTGLLATCSCVYNYKIKFKASTSDSIVILNQNVYNLNTIGVGIDEQTDPNHLIDVLYDPTIESLRIKQTSRLNLNSVSIYDRLGCLQLTVANDRSIIDLSGFAPGLYILDFVTIDKQHIMKKIIKE